MKREFVAGWLLMTAIALAATWVSRLVEIGGKHPLEAVVLAVVLGIAVRNLGWIPESCEAGVKAFEKLLIVGIILVGASLNFHNIASQGLQILGIVVVTMLVGFAVIFALGRMFKLPERLALLLALGTTICGGTAIAVTSPLMEAKEEETSYAIGTIALWGVLAIIIYPYVAQMLGVGDVAFGIFAGTAIHSTPQVVGAGFIFSEVAGKTATAVKLVRNCFLAPAAVLVSLWYARRNSAAATQRVDAARAFPWFLFGYFLMAWFNTQGYFSPEGVAAFSKAGKFFILLGMVGVGLSTRFAAFRSVGARPLLVGLIGAIVVAATSALLIASWS